MEAQSPVAHRRPAGRIAAGVGLLAAGAVAGGVLAGTLSATAASGSSPGSPYSGTGYGAAPYAAGGQHQPGPASVRADEHTLSAPLTARLRAAALRAVPGGTVDRIETDAGDGTYEAHMTKADGSLVTVKFGNDLKVTKVEPGMGSGDPALPPTRSRRDAPTPPPSR
jgi:hypothetical protein